MFGVHLRQRDKRAPVHGPRFQLRQLINCCFAFHHRSGTTQGRTHGGQSSQDAGQFPRGLQRCVRRLFQSNQAFHAAKSVAEQKPGAVHRPKQVADHGKPTVSHVGKIDGRAAGGIHTPLHLGRLQTGVDFIVDADELPGLLQVIHTLPQIAISHGLRAAG